MAEVPPITINDVWDRTSPKYRTRAIVLLIANTILFGALCCFMFWLRTGWYFPFTFEDYDRVFVSTMNLVGDQQVTLQDLLMKPISLKVVPMQAVVMGLLIASLIAIPILISILYRFVASIPFCFMVSFFAAMPWLGVNLLLSCAIAAYARVKLRFRFAAAMLGLLLPVSVYYFMASREYAGSADVLTPEIEKGLLMVPLMLSAIAACVMMAIALAIAKQVNYRPGAVTPVLAVMLLAPGFLFATNVGRDELYYHFLETDCGPYSKTLLAPMGRNQVLMDLATLSLRSEGVEDPNDSQIASRVAKLADGYGQTPLSEELRDVRHRLGLSYRTRMAREQFRIASRCDEFLRAFPTSRYRASALYIKGRALDARIHLRRLHQDGALAYEFDFPREASRKTWDTLTRDFPDSTLSTIGRYRLAQLDARQARLEPALERLEDNRHYGAAASSHESVAPSVQLPIEKLFQKEPPEASLEDELANIPLKSERLFTLLQCNQEPHRNNAPLMAYMRCDPSHPNYRVNLENILKQYPDSTVCDNVEFELIRADPDPRLRIHRLMQLEQRYPASDSIIGVLLELGVASLEAGQYADATRYFNQIIAEFPHSHYAYAARRRQPLGRLGY